ncbi:MAG: SURF1 family protein [Actinomycetota bacterium]|nr:SURF1 family protein [Actinomycetota bacterium]MDH4017404.1 SURF1 family protein [Actinomycetota bacterium]
MSSGGSWTDPRRLGFHALTVLAVLVCIVAARWQWDRASRTEADAVPEGPVVELSALDPASTFSGMSVRITGTFDPANEVLVDPRPREGQDGSWVLTPMLPTQTAGEDPVAGDQPADPAGTSVAVVRGWVPRGQRPEPPPAGVVEVVGVLVADARRPGAVVSESDPPTVVAVDTGALSAHAGYPVRSGWFALARMQPAGEGQPLPLLVAELPGADVGLNWRNAAYATQWVVFAGFAIFFWTRFRREHVTPSLEQEIPR